MSRNKIERRSRGCVRRLSAVVILAGSAIMALGAQSSSEEQGLRMRIDRSTGKYAIAIAGASTEALTAGVAAQVDGRWLRASDYPRKDGKVISVISGIVFAVSPQQVVNNYIEVEGGDREEGWMPKDAMQVYPDTCIPKLMSNGRLAVGH